MNAQKSDRSLPVPPFSVSEKGEVLAKLQEAKPELTIRELAQLTGISASHVSRLLKRKRAAASPDNT